MLIVGLLAFVIGAFGWWLGRRTKLAHSRGFLGLLVAAVVLPFVANSCGWIFTEMGRQPWVVFGLLQTSAANSPSVSTGEVLTSLIGFTLLYGVLAVIAGRIFVAEARHGVATDEQAESGLALAY